jgi:hypothetical protein
MIDVGTPADFEAILREKNAVLFVFAEWSSPAIQRSELVESWERSSFRLNSPPGSRIFRVQPWGLPYAHNWIYKQPELQFRNADGRLTCLAAVGTLVWLRSGIVVDVARAFALDLNELTAFATSQGKERGEQ